MRSSTGGVGASALVLTVAVAVTSAGSLGAPFFFDDIPGIVTNESIRHLSDLTRVLAPPPDATGAAGRPIVNLSLALNHALGGLDPRGYHVANLGFHLAAALALLGCVRHTLNRLGFPSPLGVATAVALLWAVHPLQTESVTCVIQRSEVLGGLFYLLVLYGFLRGVATPPKSSWLVVSVGACALGMASKEFVVSAPLLTLLYDRTFVAGSFRAAWSSRRGYYLGLAATWLILTAAMQLSASRGGTVGFGLGLSAWDYALTQCHALVLYLRLAVWPYPLVLDYGFDTVTALSRVLVPALAVLALLGATWWALVRRPALGFLGAWFFALLAPSSSFVPLVTQTIAEHRMYLPLAAVITALVIGVSRWLPRSRLAVAVLAASLGFLTTERNRDYRSEQAIWADTVAKRPTNPRAHTHLGNVQAAAGHHADAIAHYREAVRLRPDFVPAYINLGETLSITGRNDEALGALRKALALRPTSAEAELNLGVALDRAGQPAAARAAYERALARNPRLALAHANLGDALLRSGETGTALRHLDEAGRLQPDNPAVLFKLAMALARSNRLDDAQHHFKRAAARRAPDAVVLLGWGDALLAAGHADAVAQYEAAIRLQGDWAEAHFHLGSALAARGNFEGARSAFTRVVMLQPDHAAGHNNLANALTVLRRDAEAVPHYERSLAVRPGNATTHHNLALAYARLGRLREALPHFEAASRLAPDVVEARANLQRARQELGLPSP